MQFFLHYLTTGNILVFTYKIEELSVIIFLTTCHLKMPLTPLLFTHPPRATPRSAFDIHGLEVLSEWLSVSVCDDKLHRFNPGESSRWVWWRSPWAGLELNSMLYIHIKRKKYGRYSCLYDAEINLSAWLGVNLLPAFAKYCFTLRYTIFYLLLAINIKQHKGVMFSSILLQNDNKFAAL